MLGCHRDCCTVEKAAFCARWAAYSEGDRPPEDGAVLQTAPLTVCICIVMRLESVRFECRRCGLVCGMDKNACVGRENGGVWYVGK